MRLKDLHDKKAKNVKIVYNSWSKKVKQKEYRIFNYIDEKTFKLTWEDGHECKYYIGYESNDNKWQVVNSSLIRERLGVK